MKQILTRPQIIWEPDKYRKLSHAQEQSANQLFEIFPLKNFRSALDLGCGDGKVTTLLLKKLEIEKLLAVDISAEMISYAEKRFLNNNFSNVQFKQMNALNISHPSKYDLIFSSFVFQWIEDKKLMIKKLHKSLKKSGLLALIVPTNVSPELSEAIELILKDTFWGQYFNDFHPNWYFTSGEEIVEDLRTTNFETVYMQETTQTVNFKTKNELEEYIRLWLPHTNHLKTVNPHMEEFFFSRLMDEYYKILPPNNNGTVAMRIPRIDYIGIKPNL